MTAIKSKVKYSTEKLLPAPRRLGNRKPLICALGVKGLGDNPLRVDVTLYSALETHDCSAPIRYRFSTYAVGRRREYPAQFTEEYHADKWAHLFPADYQILARLNGSDAESGSPLYGSDNGFYWLAGACGGLKQQYHGGNSTPAKTPLECLKIAAELMRISEDAAKQMVSALVLSDNPKKTFDDLIQPVKKVWAADAHAAKERFGLPYINGRIGC